MRDRAVVILVTVAVLVVAVGAFVVWPRGTSPVTEQEALDDFRSQSTATTDDNPPRGLPPAGVYRYASIGEESVKLGPLPAEDRTYPDTMSVTIVHVDATCFTMTLNLLDQHTEDTKYCLTPDGGLRIDGHVKHQQIGVLTPTATVACDPDLLVAGDLAPTTLTCSLTLAGGPAQLSANLVGSATTTESSTTVAGERHAALEVNVDYKISGGLSGSWSEHIWFAADDWVPLRIERSFDLSGLATFTETSALELVEMEPQQ